MHTCAKFAPNSHLVCRGSTIPSKGRRARFAIPVFACRYIPSEKIGQNFHPSESCFFVINYQHWTGRSAFGPFLALLDHGGGLGGPGGVMRGLKTLKMTLSIGDHLRPWNAMFWVVTTSYTMFLWFWVKTGPSGPKKGRFWPK